MDFSNGFSMFFPLVETSKRFPFIFFHSTFSRSKRQSKKRSRARQSDARSSVGPEDCQRRVKPFSKSRVVNLRELFV